VVVVPVVRGLAHSQQVQLPIQSPLVVAEQEEPHQAVLEATADQADLVQLFQPAVVAELVLVPLVHHNPKPQTLVVPVVVDINALEVVVHQGKVIVVVPVIPVTQLLVAVVVVELMQEVEVQAELTAVKVAAVSNNLGVLVLTEHLMDMVGGPVDTAKHHQVVTSLVAVEAVAATLVQKRTTVAQAVAAKEVLTSRVLTQMDQQVQETLAAAEAATAHLLQAGMVVLE
jgi:hypothetical protein